MEMTSMASAGYAFAKDHCLVCDERTFHLIFFTGDGRVVDHPLPVESVVRYVERLGEVMSQPPLLVEHGTLVLPNVKPFPIRDRLVIPERKHP